MSSTKSQPGIKLKPYVQTNFTGLDSSTDVTAQDAQDNQALDVCKNAYCDWRGQIVRNPAGLIRKQAGAVTHVRFYAVDDDETNVVFAEQNDFAISLKSDKDHTVEDAYPTGSVVSSTVFSNKVHLTAQAGDMYSYNGLTFEQNPSPSLEFLSPKYLCTVQRRLVVAGLIGRPTEVQLSRVDSDEIFPDDEDPNDENVLRAGSIEIGNLLGQADEIRGIAPFEQNRLAVATKNRTLIYVIDPDINNWVLDDRANINIGTISHNTMRQAGTDLLFCSEHGVHSVARSRDNGILVFSNLLSGKVDLIYRRLLKLVANPEQISALWNQETAQYEIFFPLSSNVGTRLTLTLNASEGNPQSWSTSDYLHSLAGAISGGRMILGTNGGLYEIFDPEDDSDDLAEIEMDVKTPVLWHGSMTEDKEGHSIFIHAAGKGDLLVEVYNDQDQLLKTYPLQIEDDNDGSFPDNPLNRQYIRKFEARYRGLRVRIKSKGRGLIRIAAIGFNVRQ